MSRPVGNRPSPSKEVVVSPLRSVSLPGAATGDAEDGAFLSVVVSWSTQGADLADLVAPRRPMEPTPSAKQRRNHDSIRGSESREVRVRSRDIYTGDVPLRRLDGKLLSGEGFIEIHLWIMLEFHLEDMIDAFAQPGRMKISLFGVGHHWTPDALVRRRNKRDLLIEVKPLEVVQPSGSTPLHVARMMEERVSAMRAAAAADSKDFLLLTEHDIRMEPRFFNAKMMFRAHGANISERILAQAVKALRHMDEICDIMDLAEALPEYRTSALLVACLLDRAGHIRIDRSNFFTPTSEFENYIAATGENLVPALASRHHE